MARKPGRATHRHVGAQVRAESAEEASESGADLAFWKVPQSEGTEAGAKPVLGESMGLYLADAGAVIVHLRRGLPMAALDRLSRAMDTPIARLAEIARIAPRTLARRRKEGRLQPEESERIYRLAALFERAVDVLGGRKPACAWMQAPARALGGVSPLQFADTEVGAREVEDLLGRLEHGVYS